MTAEVLLLTTIAVSAVLSTALLLTVAVVLLRTLGDVQRTQQQVNRLLDDINRELAPTVGDTRSLVRSLTDLSGSGRRIAEEAALTLMGRRLRGGSAASPSPRNQVLAGVQTGLDVAFRVLDLWQRSKSVRAKSRDTLQGSG
ncbi:MAG: hypothetical protein WD535_03590 [Thermaerobacterales bacterium]